MQKEHGEKKAVFEKSFVRLFLPSILGILFCTICLFGTTFAWFSGNETLAADPIRSASYEVALTLDDAAFVTRADQVASLSSGTYTVTLTATGDASLGYCIFHFGDGSEIHTESILPNGEPVTLILEITGENATATLWVEARWGKPDSEKQLFLAGRYTYLSME